MDMAILIAWLVVIALACIGIGRLCRTRQLTNEAQLDSEAPHLQPGIDMAVGLAVFVALAGIASLIGWFGMGLVLGFVIVGGLACCFRLFHHGRALAGAGRLAIRYQFVLLAIVGVVLARLIVAAGLPMNTHDDYHAYLVFPMKLWQTGTLGYEPFSSKRLSHGLGGQYALNALALVVGSWRNINVIDGGLGLIMLVLVFVDVLRRNGAAPVFVIVGTAIVVLLPHDRVNTTTTVLAVGWLLAAATVAQSIRGAADAICLGLIGGALCACKSTLIAPAVLLCAIAIAMHMMRPGAIRTVLVKGALCAAAALLVLLPWMIQSLLDTGTLLYPILGGGTHASSFGGLTGQGASMFDPATIKRLITVDLPMNASLFALLVMLALLVLKRIKPGAGMAGLAAAALISAGVLYVMVTPTWFPRLWQPIALAATLGLIAVSAGQAQRENRTPAVVGLTLLVGLSWHALTTDIWLWKDAATDAITQPWVQDDAKAQQAMSAMQAAIPAGQVFLARLDQPFLLDFTRNPVWIIDHPGEASPVPLFPDQRPNHIAGALRSADVRYVAYSHGNEAGHPQAYFGKAMDESLMDWDSVKARNTLLFQAHLVALSRQLGTIYDDGHHLVIDLFSPVIDGPRPGDE